MDGPVVEVADRALFDETLGWTRQWWDDDAAMLWNPDGAFPELADGRTLHQVPNTAWFAWSLLATGDDGDQADAERAIGALLALQFDATGTAYDGTFRRFLEWPELPPADPVMWDDYDPNWRQFVGTTFALTLEDFGDRLSGDLATRMLVACRRAAEGEPDGRIPTSYTNPALMRAWLDAWVGTRCGAPALLERGEAFAERVVERFDRIGTFDEFNSPTYAGIDLYALALWRTFGPTPLFREHGERLEDALWDELTRLYHPGLKNWVGPYTRSYHPDATRSVAKASLWLWAEHGRAAASLPPLDSGVHHGHDLASGPVISRLHRTIGRAAALARPLPRRFTATIGDRSVDTWMADDVMIGIESSQHDWGGWDQMMPVVAHWAAGTDVETLWLSRPHLVRAELDAPAIEVQVAGTDHIEWSLRADEVTVDGTDLVTGHRRIDLGVAPTTVESGPITRIVVPVTDGRVEIRPV